MFTVSPDQLHGLLDPKSLAALEALGGTDTLIQQLRSDAQTGLCQSHVLIPLPDNDNPAVAPANTSANASSSIKLDSPAVISDAEERRAFYGTNSLPQPHSKSLLRFAWEALHDKILILLVFAATFEIAVGIWKAIDKNDFLGIYDGLGVVAAVLLVVGVTAGNDWRKQGQFRSLNDFSRELAVTKVVRNGQTIQIKNGDILVGDIVVVETGDVLSADGLFLSGSNLKCDESSLTGESDAALKNAEKDPFLISGTKVTSGVGRMMVIGTGVNSFNGRIMVNLATEPEDTPLQSKLTELAVMIAKIGIAAAVSMVVLLVVAYFTANTAIQSGESVNILEDMINIIISAIAVVVVAVPEGLPLAVTLALAHATLRMLKDNNLVRHLSACETMGNATAICSDKTGTLTQNRMTVVRARILDTAFALADLPPVSTRPIREAFAGCAFTDAAVRLIGAAVNVNSSAAETERAGSEQKGDSAKREKKKKKKLERREDDSDLFQGSKTEIALLELTRGFGLEYQVDRAEADVVELLPFSSEHKKMVTVVRPPASVANVPALGSAGYLLYSKGASEIIISDCTRYMDAKGDVRAIDDKMRRKLSSNVSEFANDALRTLCIAVKPMDEFKAGESVIVPEGNDEIDSTAARNSSTSVPKILHESNNDMILLGLFGIQDPVRPEVPAAVATCQKAGICVRMVTGDNAETARAIAKQCGILTGDGIVIEGPEFRKLELDRMDELVPRLQVMARSSPLDKQILVQCLKRLGETVAVTGDGTNDAPALRSADVGFSMGIAGTEVAKEASDIVLLDDCFTSLVKAVVWGRSVYDSVRKFLQFQLTVNVSAVILTIITSLISTISTESNTPQAALAAIQLLWVNLIMDTGAALALATDRPSEHLLERRPARKSDPLINGHMWKQIIGQAIYQIVICMILYLRSEDIFFGFSAVNEKGVDVFAQTVVFNTFVMCQLFNEINCRSISRDLNIFRGILQNHIFMIIVFVSLVIQILIVEFGGVVFHVVPLDWKSWLICVAFGTGSIPIGVLLRLLPRMRPGKRNDDNELIVTNEEVQAELADLLRIVVESQENGLGRPLTLAEKQNWMTAIQHSSSQINAMGGYSYTTRNAFREGVLLGAQMALTVSPPAAEQVSFDADGNVEKTSSRGRELWSIAGTKVRRQVTVIDAFRRHRRDNTLGLQLGKGSPASTHSYSLDK